MVFLPIKVYMPQCESSRSSLVDRKRLLYNLFGNPVEMWPELKSLTKIVGD
jgi:hypothetical protein